MHFVLGPTSPPQSPLAQYVLSLPVSCCFPLFCLLLLSSLLPPPLFFFAARLAIVLVLLLDVVEFC